MPAPTCTCTSRAVGNSGVGAGNRDVIGGFAHGLDEIGLGFDARREPGGLPGLHLHRRRPVLRRGPGPGGRPERQHDRPAQHQRHEQRRDGDPAQRARHADRGRLPALIPSADRPGAAGPVPHRSPLAFGRRNPRSCSHGTQDRHQRQRVDLRHQPRRHDPRAGRQRHAVRPRRERRALRPRQHAVRARQRHPVRRQRERPARRRRRERHAPRRGRE